MKKLLPGRTKESVGTCAAQRCFGVGQLKFSPGTAKLCVGRSAGRENRALSGVRFRVKPRVEKHRWRGPVAIVIVVATSGVRVDHIGYVASQ